jgi:hypothetical protein
MFTVRMPVVLSISNEDRSRARRVAEKKRIDRIKQIHEQFKQIAKDEVEYLQNLRKAYEIKEEEKTSTDIKESDV